MSCDEEVAAMLKRLEILLATLAKRQIADRVTEINSDKAMRVLYENVGVLKQTELAKKAGMAQSSVSQILQKWEAEGLLFKDGTTYRRVF